MKNSIKKIGKILIVVTLIVLIITGISYWIINNNNKKVLSSVSDLLPNQDEQKELKVIVIEINPILNSITDTSLYPNNDGHPKVSDWFSKTYAIPQDPEKLVNTLVQDLEETSHGYLDVNIVDYEWLNEFTKYTVINEQEEHGYCPIHTDEETFILNSRYEDTNYGDYYKYESSDYKRLTERNGNCGFDYSYIINKYDLINRRNNKEFDQVWLVGYTPMKSSETAMIGRNAYPINGDMISTYVNSQGQRVSADCDNFILAGFDISRPGGSTMHSLGHSVEWIMKRVMGEPMSQSLPLANPPAANGIYSMNLYNINSKEAYNQLNLWEKFTLCNWNNTNGNYTGVGGVHFPFNSSYNYDYFTTESIKTYTNWREWLDYPNVTGDNFVLDDENAWINYDLNSSVELVNGGRDYERLYIRFWFSLLPHVSGYTGDGFYNNWWKYWYTLDYVTSIENKLSSTNISAEQYKDISVDYSINYYSGQKERVTNILEGTNIKISNKNVLGYRKGKLYAKGIGQSNVTVYRDGESITYSVSVGVSSDTGWQQYGDAWYYFDNSGHALTGLQYISSSGKYYYFAENGDEVGQMQTGWIESGNKWYYFNDSGEMFTGLQYIASVGKYYYFAENGNAIGQMQTGWIEIDEKWYYFNDSGEMLTGVQYIASTGKYYYFAESGDKIGQMQTGWVSIGEKWYYLRSSGEMLTGLHYIDSTGKYHYFGDYNSDKVGQMQTGWVQVGDNWYYFDDTGKMLTGLQYIASSGKYHYFEEFNNETLGQMQTGWIEINEKWYYFNDSGEMFIGLQYIASVGKYYYFAENGNAIGQMQTGWIEVEDKWYYFDNSGKMLTGLHYIASTGKYFYFEANNASTLGQMQTGWVIIGGKWYYFDDSGKMLTGLQLLSYNGKEDYYYFEQDDSETLGQMLTGWKKIDNNWYYFKNEELEVIAYYGAALKGLYTIDSNLYYFRKTENEISTGPKASMLKGLATIDGYEYYFRNSKNEISTGPEGSAVKNVCTTINNQEYCFDDSGRKTGSIISAIAVHINKTTITLGIGEVQTLIATVSPSDATDRTVTWTSNKTSVAKVNSNGKVTAVSAGTATITATTSNGKTATCTVTVTDQVVEATGVTINKSKLTLVTRDEYTLTATVLPSNTTDKTVTWTSNKTSVAKVNSNGKVTAVSTGTATITATTSNGKTATCTVTVTAPIVSATGITLNKSSINLQTGGYQVLSATVLPSDASNKSVSWSSSNESVAKVASNGKVTAVSAGTATITATTHNGKTATCTVTVTDRVVNPTEITLDSELINIENGGNYALTATVLPSNATNKTVTWTSSDESVATVTSDGRVVAVSLGSAIITATTHNGKTATCNVVVTNTEVTPTSISLNKSTLNLNTSETYNLIYTLLPSNATNKTIEWTSNNTAVASVSASGEVTAIAPGTAKITVTTYNGKKATCAVTVKEPVVNPSGIVLNKNTLSLEVNTAETLVATVSPSNATNKTIGWTSNDETIATVNANGKITAISEGTVIITAETINGKKATCELTVYRNETPTPKSNDSSLRSLIPNVGGLTPEFTSNNQNYSMSIDFTAVRSINFAATQNHSLANVGSTECTIPNSTTVENIVCNITVTAENLSTSTYHITINNSAYVEIPETPDVIRVENIRNSVNGVLKPAFNQDTHRYEMDLNFANYEQVVFEVDTESLVTVAGDTCIIPKSLNVESVTCNIQLTKGNQTTNYKIVINNTNKPNNMCNLRITSTVYTVDEASRTIKVPSTASAETIRSNLTSSCGEIRVLSDKVVLTDENTSKEYKLEKIVILQTGNKIVHYKFLIIAIMAILGIGFIITFILRNKKSIE